jgi:acetyl-CoA carboxylase carboxyltransferase component
MGGAKVHCEQSGVGHFLCKDEDEAVEALAQAWLEAGKGQR